MMRRTENITAMKSDEYHHNTYNKSCIQGVTGDRRGERLLELSLPALVIGENHSGRKFRETTELMAISSEQAQFRLKTQVRIGSCLTLILNIPATPLLVHPLRLEVSGRVSSVEVNGHSKPCRLVTVKLEKKFQLSPYNPNSGN